MISSLTSVCTLLLSILSILILKIFRLKPVEKEKEIAAAQLTGKPAEIIEKILVGKINKWYTETCVTKQPWLER